ncbi:hypothetical protein FQU75_00060 [Paenibacillus polymyxa]|nr:hypothetical protein FQU75_00060 [Paenibacillus polymyxa]
MKVEWKLSIGYPSACREGEVEIDDEDLKGKSREQVDEIINEAIWEDSMQYADVYPTNTEEIEEAIKRLTGGGKGE